MTSQEAILVRASRQIYLDYALVSEDASGTGAHREEFIIVPKGTVGVIEGESKLGPEYKIVSFERPFTRGFITRDVRTTNIAEI